MDFNAITVKTEIADIPPYQNSNDLKVKALQLFNGCAIIKQENEVPDSHPLKMDYGYCDKCKQCFHLLKFHKKYHHHDKYEIRCTICGRLFLKRPNLIKHLLKHDSSDIKCFCCHCDEFNDFEELFNHLEEHAILRIYSCDKCKATFAIKSNLNAHSVIHSNGRREHKCLKCEMNFDARRSGMRKFKQHWIIFHKNNLKCDECNKRFTKFDVFYYHCMRHKNELPFVCDKCGLGFRKNCRLKEHIKAVHLNTFNFTCDICDLKFKHQPVFDAHIRSHDKSLCFSCNYCSKLFIRKLSLLDHFTEKSCSFCDEEFHCKTTFNTHFETEHKGDRLFSCDECDRSYSLENHLKRHKTMEHLKETECHFKCILCPYETVTKHNLNRHKRRNH